MFTFSRIGSLAFMIFLAAGCAVESSEPPDSTSAAATEEVPGSLRPFEGEWTLTSSSMGDVTRDVGTKVRIGYTQERPEGDRLGGPTLTLLDARGFRLRDRPTFMSINGGPSSSNVPQGSGTSLTVEHETQLRGGSHLVHTVRVTSYQAWFIPTGTEVSKQELWFDHGELRYRYTIDAEVAEEMTLTR